MKLISFCSAPYSVYGHLGFIILLYFSMMNRRDVFFCQQSRLPYRSHTHLACVLPARHVHNDNFSSTIVQRLNVERGTMACACFGCPGSARCLPQPQRTMAMWSYESLLMYGVIRRNVGGKGAT